MNNLSEHFSKKIGRGAYALRFFCIIFTLTFVAGTLSNFDMNQLTPFGGIIFLIAFFYVALLNIQRLNDLALSKWYLILSFVPVVSFFFVVAMLARKGKSTSIMVQNVTTNSVAKRHKQEVKNTLDAIEDRSDVKYCRHCGVKHTKGAKFCSSCGKSFA